MTNTNRARTFSSLSRSLALAAVATLALSACRPSAGYGTVPLASTNQALPPPRSVTESSGGTQVSPPSTGVPGETVAGTAEGPTGCAMGAAPAGVRCARRETPVH